jgi:hypothetical protein
MRLLGGTLLVLALVVVLAGCGGGGLGMTPTGQAVKAPVCGRAATVGTCRSPDGAWRVSLKNGVGGRACALYLTRVSTGQRTRMYGSNQDGCSYLTWAEGDLLLFQSNADLHALNPATRLVTQPAAFNEFVVSPNRRWAAGDAVGGPESPQVTVYALTANNSKCVVVPLASHRTDRVVGFTNDSKSLIVSTAPWNGMSAPPPGPTRMREFSLSTLHTDCGGSQMIG